MFQITASPTSSRGSYARRRTLIFDNGVTLLSKSHSQFTISSFLLELPLQFLDSFLLDFAVGFGGRHP